MVVKFQLEVLWVVMPCSIAVEYNTTLTWIFVVFWSDQIVWVLKLFQNWF